MGSLSGVFLGVLAVEILIAQQAPQRFGGAYSELDERRQQLVGDWVARFTKVTGQSLDAPVVLRRHSQPLHEDDIRRSDACPDDDSADRRVGPEVR